MTLAGTVSAALSAAIAALEQTYESLQGLDPGGELEQGFRDSTDCDSLTEQVQEIRS